MKKLITLTAAVLAATSVFALPKVKVGATPVPHEEILNIIKEDVEAAGFELVVVPYTDYVVPNEAVEAGDIDANYFQHIPYMESFNKEKGTHLYNAAGIHVEPFALYPTSNKNKAVKSVEELKAKKGVKKIAVPNDPSNEGRALLLLQEAGLITLKPEAGITATTLDIAKNPYKIKFVEVEAASVPRTLSDVDAAVINGNYALVAGLSAKKDGIFIEGASSPYVNILCVKEGNQDKPEIQAVINALKSEKVKEFVNEKWPSGEVVTVF